LFVAIFSTNRNKIATKSQHVTVMYSVIAGKCIFIRVANCLLKSQHVGVFCYCEHWQS